MIPKHVFMIMTSLFLDTKTQADASDSAQWGERFHKAVFFSLGYFNSYKAELLQLNRTQFPSLGLFLVKKLEIEKTKAAFIISVLKVVY